MNPTKSLMIQQVMSPASVPVSTDRSTSQYQKDLEQSKREKVVEIVKAIKTSIIKSKRLGLLTKTSPFQVFSVTFYLSYFLDLSPKLEHQYHVYLL